MKKNAIFLRWLAASLLFTCLLPLAQAQWSWKDKDGRRVFSDQPPPSSVPEKDIVKRPAGVRALAPAEAKTEAPADGKTTGAGAGTGAAAQAAAPKISGKDAELEKKKKEAEAKEAAQQKAQDDKFAADRKENCNRAKRAKSNFDSGVRISTNNAQGEREIMSDATRASESKRLQEIISSDCS